MADSKSQTDLDQQIDAMVESAGAEDAAAPDEDLAGQEFADHVQKVLDEAEATMSDEPAAGDEADADDGEGDETQLLKQIDQMLSEQADDVVAGDFQSVEEATREAEEEAAPPPAPGAPTGEPQPVAAASPSDEAAEADSLAGDMQSIDELLKGDFDDDEIQDANISPSTRPLESEMDPQSELEEEQEAAADATLAEERFPAGTFEAVAEEMDEDERATEAPAPQQSERDDEPEPAESEPVAVNAEAEDEFEAPVAVARPPGKLVSVLAKLNAPIMNRSTFQRNLVGFIGLETVCVGLCAVAYGLGGTGVAIVVGGSLSTLLVGVFYMLFCRGDGPNDTHRDSVDNHYI